MSIEKATTGKSSHFLNGEDCQDRTGQPLESDQRSGGVSGDGMLGRATEVTREACLREAQASTPGTTPSTEKVGLAQTGVGVLHSSDEVSVTDMERRRGSWAEGSEAKRERGDGSKEIITPTKSETKTGVRKLQRTLYRQAKSKPKWKAWSLYGDVCRKEVLEAALRQVIENKGVPGVDGMRVEDLKADASFRKQWMEELEIELRNKTYRPQAVRRVYKAVNGGRIMKGVMVRFADDSVILCRKGQGAEMLRRLKLWLEWRGLKLNEKKTRIVDFQHESFEFLGFRFQWRVARSGRYYPHVEPSPKSCGKLQKDIREATERSAYWKEPEEVFAQVNRQVRGWIGYFHHGNSTKVFGKMQRLMRERMRRWLWKKHAKTRGHYTDPYSNDQLHEHYRLIKFPLQAKW